MNLLVWLPLAVLALWGGVLLAFARPLIARWREPVMRHPVLILESDDWGAGPLEQADALDRLASLLSEVRDATGRPICMSLGMVFEVPDGDRIAKSGAKQYAGLSLADARFEPVSEALRKGLQTGVFAPQLHGQCHYWPDAVMSAARQDVRVRSWLMGAGIARTETLPSHLQSRWVDASVLPSRELGAETIRQAVRQEATSYRMLFGESPRVAVATTFVWSDAVEAAWQAIGIETVITPGRRATCRDGSGQPACVDRKMLTGSRAPAGLLYLVRDVYFEPALGHEPDRLWAGLAERTAQRRPCLVEIHRFNFLDAPTRSLETLRTALLGVLARQPNVRFLSPEALARAIRERDPAWVETQPGARLSAWRARLGDIPRFSRLARLTGLGWVLA